MKTIHRKRRSKLHKSPLLVKRSNSGSQKHKRSVRAIVGIDEQISLQSLSLSEQVRNNKISLYAIAINGLVNGVLSAATLYLAVYTRDMAVSTEVLRDSALAQLKKIDDSIAASVRQAKASEQANNITRSSSEGQLRAYIVEERTRINNIVSSQMYSSIDLKNVGQTPAYKVGLFANSAIVKKSGDSIIVPSHMNDFCRGGANGQLTVGANDEATYLLPRTDQSGQTIESYDKKELQGVLDGNSVYMVWGEICYQDIFYKTHFTKFCRYYRNISELNSNTQTTCATDNEIETSLSPPQ